MSLETVVEDIRERARERAEEIEQETEERAEEIVSEAEAEAEEITAEREREVARQIEQERDRQLSSARLEAKQERLAARRDVFATVRDRVESELAALDGDTREELTGELLEAGLAEFDGPADVYARPADSDLVTSLLEGYDAELAGERDCLGGVVVEGTGTRLRVNNTFDAILDDVWDETVREISDRLFDETER